MKEKLVLWAHDAQDKKQLLAIELVAKENVVKIHSFPEEVVTEDFYSSLMNDWKNGKEVEMPAGGTVINRPLSVTEDLLPEELKVERTDLVNRAKTEWHFIVLSLKLYDLYQGEINDIKDKANQAQEYSQSLWEEAKGFWDKVQTQIRERNLFRDHAQDIKKTTNEVFDHLKALRKTMDTKFKEASKESVSFFNEKLNAVNEKIDSGKSLNPIFDELKKIQREFKDASFTRDDRNKMWKKIDSAFKKVKDKKYGGQEASGMTPLKRLENRYEGLLKAIDRMQSSIGRDLRDKNRENDFINRSDGQLESQLRQAKLQMIDQRIASKNVKLEDMISTKKQLEDRIAKEKEREVKRQEKKEMDALKAKKKEEIAERISAAASVVVEENKEELKDAVSALEEAKSAPKSESSEEPKGEETKEEVHSEVEDIVEEVKETFQDVVQDVKIGAAKLLDKIKDVVDDAADALTGEEE